MEMTQPLQDALYWTSTGTGAPVVALHGSASAGAQWRSLSEHLAARFRVIAPDLAGYGRSGQPAARASLAAEAAFLRPALAAAGEPVHLVGHSFGGAVALAVAITMPESVRSLTLIEPAAFRLLMADDLTDRMLGAEIGCVADDVRSTLRIGRRTEAAARFIDYWNGDGAWARSSPRLQGLILAAMDRVAENFTALAAPGLTARALSRLHCPTLVIAGLETPLPALRTAELVAETIPNAQLALIHGVGHMAPLTDPHIVDPMIAAHLSAAVAHPRPAPALAA
ncbi:alpha/beta fold hydrolase [Pararhodobacter sp. SW119]|uniref:alpha/beta fold hydrolase n=1 Tax=Pararhodobacter sp. SW119 TaxID=2780075 RepID=UPI001AE025A2|nr:alpha/beta fold hydrolase [Pararhodobacter sp. SW119]